MRKPLTRVFTLFLAALLLCGALAVGANALDYKTNKDARTITIDRLIRDDILPASLLDKELGEGWTDLAYDVNYFRYQAECPEAEAYFLAIKRGNTKITAKSAQGDTWVINVSIRFSFVQWLRYIFLGEWLFTGKISEIITFIIARLALIPYYPV